jgi:[ribosomal protein S18]-alanine N-acetyltransferase
MIPRDIYLSVLTADDIPGIESIEQETSLAYWGAENYRKFLVECPEYFGAKAVILLSPGKREVGGFHLSRAVFENLEVLKVGVLTRHQRAGIGSQLMESAYAEGIRRGCSRCFLEVRKSNESAIRFYLRHRFRFAGSRQNYYRDPVEDAWVMERPL